MYKYQSDALECAIERLTHYLQDDPLTAYDHLAELAESLPSVLWKMRVQPKPETYVDFELAIARQRFEYMVDYPDMQDHSDHPDEFAARIDDYAFELEWALAMIHAYEVAQARRVLFMLKTWLKNEKLYTPTRKKTKKAKATKTRRIVPKAKHTAWDTAKVLAHQADTITPKGTWKVDNTRCMLVTESGVMSVGYTTLLFASGEVTQSPGIYNAKTGEHVTESTQLQQFYDTVFNAPRHDLYTVTVPSDELLDAVRFCNAISQLTTLSMGAQGFTVSSGEPIINPYATEGGNARVDLGGVHPVDFSILCRGNEVEHCISVMPGDLTITAYTNGDMSISNATTRCLLIKG